jgi:hypothetical protein
MEEDFIAYLLADAGVAAAVGTRVKWLQRPQASALPSITLQRVSIAPANDQCGADALKETLIQIDCWGATYARHPTTLVAGALEVARAVEAAVSGKSFTHGSTEFQSLFITGGDDTTEPGSTTGSVIYRTRIDVQIWHKEN